MLIQVYPKMVPLDGGPWTVQATRAAVRVSRKEADRLGWTVVGVYQKERDVYPKVVVTFDVPESTTLEDVWAWAQIALDEIRAQSDGTQFRWKVCVGGDLKGRIEGVYP